MVLGRSVHQVIHYHLRAIAEAAPLLLNMRLAYVCREQMKSFRASTITSVLVMNMKMKHVLFGGLFLLSIAAATAAPTVTTSDLLNIGNANVLLQTSSGYTTFNSIAGGQNNTNNAWSFSTVGGGGANSIGTNLSYAVVAGGAQNVVNSASGGAIGGGYLNKILRTNSLPMNDGLDPNLSGNEVIAGGAGNLLISLNSVISGGAENKIESLCWHSVVAGGLQNVIEFGCGYSTISGGSGNKIAGGAKWAAISGGAGNEIEYFEPMYTTNVPVNHFGWIGGGAENYISGPQSLFGSIGAGVGNLIQGYVSTIAGGDRNELYGNWSVITAGRENIIETNAYCGTIGGGQTNKIKKGTQWCTIAGGLQNTIGTNSTMCTIGGGQFNNINPDVFSSTIPGGYYNAVEKGNAFAAGSHATAAHSGAFVWSDWSSGATFASTNNNEFAARAHGGFRFETGATPTGVKLSPGSGSWASLCDRNAKANFVPVNTRTVLEKVAALPLKTWNYKDQDENVRHMGPVAQDFHAAFGVGDDDRTITTVDADGVALAAIQGLHELVKEKDAALKDQQKTLNELSARLQALEKMLLNQVSAK